MARTDRRYFLAKHDLLSLRTLPNFIWYLGNSPDQYPKGYRPFRPGDRWVSFAYTVNDGRERAISQITGFYECMKPAEYRAIPRRALGISGRYKYGWMIEGRELENRRLQQPVGIRPLAEVLDRGLFNQQAISTLSREEYDLLWGEVKGRRFDPSSIPILHREPRNEQEVLAVVLGAARNLGIEKVLRVRTRFPDLQVKLKGVRQPVHLELETYSRSFCAHCHDGEVHGRRLQHEDEAERLPVGLLCWIHDDKGKVLTRCVGKNVFELQSLFRERRPIRWHAN